MHPNKAACLATIVEGIHRQKLWVSGSQTPRAHIGSLFFKKEHKIPPSLSFSCTKKDGVDPRTLFEKLDDEDEDDSSPPKCWKEGDFSVTGFHL